MDDSFDSDEYGGNKFDNACFVVRTIYVLGMDWFREAMTWKLVAFNKTPIEAIDQGTAIHEGLGDDIFAEGVFEDR